MAGAEAGAAGSAGAATPLPPRILNITVPHVGQRPLMALRPFFIVSSTPSTISFLALHLTQYPSGIKISLPRRFMRRGSYGSSLGSRHQNRQVRKDQLRQLRTLGVGHQPNSSKRIKVVSGLYRMAYTVRALDPALAAQFPSRVWWNLRKRLRNSNLSKCSLENLTRGVPWQR